MTNPSGTRCAVGEGLTAGEADGHPDVGLLRSPRVAIIGAGMSGIGMAAKLRLAGIESFQVYEKWSDVGGTWHPNTYPGLTCDIPSRYYSYTFAPNPNWSPRDSAGPRGDGRGCRCFWVCPGQAGGGSPGGAPAGTRA